MGVKAVHQKIVGIIKKYRYVILVLFIGLALMAIPSRENTSETAVKVSDEHAEEKVTVEEKLAQILSQVDGAGEVRVLLTIAVGEETLFQADEDVTTDAESSSTQISTVVMLTKMNTDSFGKRIHQCIRVRSLFARGQMIRRSSWQLWTRFQMSPGSVRIEYLF